MGDVQEESKGVSWGKSPKKERDREGTQGRTETGTGSGDGEKALGNQSNTYTGTTEPRE